MPILRRCLGSTAAAASGDAVSGAEFRNIAIVAHVDHGKSTLTDSMLNATDAKSKLNERVMDHNDLEKERGITILSKVTSMAHKSLTFNVTDTPGHSDFSGEVERVLSMVDGILLVVCATEGPMPQTKYVLSKALKLGLRPIVVLNKVDRISSRVTEVENEVFELFINLDASDEQLEYRTIYASAKAGWAVADMPASPEAMAQVEAAPDMTPLLDAIADSIPAPVVDDEQDELRMLVSIMESDPTVHLGKLLLTGRIVSGSCKTGDKVSVLNPDGTHVGDSAVVKMYKRIGMARYEIESSSAGDIVTLSGVAGARVADTVCAPAVAAQGPLVGPSLDPPTISMLFAVNDSPLSGDKKLSGGSKLTLQQIHERLVRETESNIAVQVDDLPRLADGRDSYEVRGRGEMQLGILIENMRREGFELSVSPPTALLRKDDAGKTLEPVEEVEIDVAESNAGAIMELVAARKGELFDTNINDDGSRRKMTFHIPSRGMVGMRTEVTRTCRGDAVVNALFLEYQPWKGPIGEVRKGVLIASAQGTATEYSLTALESRGELFVRPGDEVYTGMLVGESSRREDLEINVAKTKKLTNMRAAGKDDFSRLVPPREFTLEQIIGYVQPDELVEVTPVAVRPRKSLLDATLRKQAGRRKKVQK